LYSILFQQISTGIYNLKKSIYKNMIRLFIKNSVVLVTLFTLYSCNSTEPDDKITLSAVDASCTEVWLQITGETGKEIQLIRDDIEIERFTLTASPMTIIDDSLQINTSYNYQVVRSDNGEKSSTATATTLDTTSHNFTWQSWTFDGDAGSSTLYGCAIISEDDIWCVGEILIRDTSENGYTTYNAAHWNGNEWELKRITFSFRILYPGSMGDTIGITPITSIFAFDQNNIWFAAGTVQNWNGNQFTEFQGEYAGFAYKIWGSSPSNLYFVGGNGTIVHYENGQWTKIESGTDLSIADIYGAENKSTGELEILAIASRNYPSGRALYKLEGNKATEISLSPIRWDLFSVWFMPERRYYVAGSGIYEKRILSDSSWKNEPLDITNYGMSAIRGNGINDIYSVGAFGETLHYNGVRWESFIDETGFDGSYGDIAVKNNVIVAVGSEGQLAKVMIGKKNN
jgi:hypothetical protein